MSKNISISTVRANARKFRMALDTPNKLNHRRSEECLPHLQECISHPTIGLLARAEAEKNIRYHGAYETNFRNLTENKFPILEYSLAEKFDINYPKTAKSRIFLIANENVVLGTVKKKANSIAKTLFKWFGLMV